MVSSTEMCISGILQQEDRFTKGNTTGNNEWEDCKRRKSLRQKQLGSEVSPPTPPLGPHVLAVTPVGTTHSSLELTQLFLTDKNEEFIGLCN